MVVDVDVVPLASNLIVFVLSVLSAIVVDASINVLFVNVSAVPLATNVSVLVGIVIKPPLDIAVIIGVVIVLFVNTWVVSVPTIVVSAFGTVKVLVVAVVNPDNWNCIFLVLSPSSAK